VAANCSAPDVTETRAAMPRTLLLGVALTAATTLMLELLLTRVFDVVLLPSIAYMVITCAVFAYGLAGLYVTVRPLPEEQGVDQVAARFTLLVALASVLLLPAINIIPFERRFGNTVSWSSAAAAHLSLSQLVAQAQELKARCRRPVLVVLGHPAFLTDPTGEARMFYRKRFTWTAGEREEAERSLVRVAEFWTAFSDENYSVYAVK
jgi:hypothetical protein